MRDTEGATGQRSSFMCKHVADTQADMSKEQKKKTNSAHVVAEHCSFSFGYYLIIGLEKQHWA